MDKPELNETSAGDWAEAKLYQIANRRLLTCEPDTPVIEAARLMRENHCGSVVVTSGGRPVGIWTERDVYRVDFADPASFDQPISAVMSKPVRSIGGRETLNAARLIFSREKIRHLVVEDDDGHPLGMVSQTDIVLSHRIEHYLTFREVRSVMSTSVLVIDTATPFDQAVGRMREAKVEAALITSPAWPAAGIVTERDILYWIAERRSGTVGDAATRPVISVSAGDSLLEARDICVQNRFRHLAVRDENGAFVGILNFSNLLSLVEAEYLARLDIALRERDEALIRSRQDLDLARQVIDGAATGVLIVNTDGQIEWVNPAFCQTTGYSPEEAIGQTPRLLKSGRHDVAFYRQMWDELANSGRWQGEIWNRRKDGAHYLERLAINTIRHADGQIAKYAGVFLDITESKLQEERLHRLAYHDPLTRLPNRRLLMERLHAAMDTAAAEDGQFGVLFIDLDEFKQVNDALGHDAGDRVLIEVADRLRECVRDQDLVARMGGDEFVILLPTLTQPEAAATVARRVRHALSRPIDTGGQLRDVGCSVGIAIFPDDATDVDSLLSYADRGMYSAKNRRTV